MSYGLGKSNAYARIKEAEIRAALTPEEQEELEHLEALKDRSMDEEFRIEELWAKAFRDHVAPQVDPLVDYAREVGEKMWGERS